MELNYGLVRKLAHEHEGKLGVDGDNNIKTVAFRSTEHKMAFYNDLVQGKKEGKQKLIDSLDHATDCIYEAVYYYGINDDRLIAIAEAIDALVNEYENA